MISTNFLAQSTLVKLWSPMSPQHLWRSTTHTRSTTSTLRYFYMPFPVKNLIWMWSSRWPQDTSSRRSMNTSVSGNQTHICCGNRFQHIHVAWWWIRVLSALHVNVTLPILSHDLCVPHNKLTCRYFLSNVPANLSKHKVSDHSWSLAWWYR